MTSVEWLESPSLAELEPVSNLLNRWNAAVIAGERPAPVDELHATVCRAPAHQQRHLGLIRDGRSLLGAVLLSMEDLDGRRRDAVVDFLVVEPSSRRRGTGSALLEAALARTRSAGRERLSGIAPLADEAAAGFAVRHGADREMVERQNRVSTSRIDSGLLMAWANRASERAAEYALIAVDGPCPDELLGPLARLNDVMNSAPHGPNLEDLHLTPANLTEIQCAFEAQGYRRWTVIARHEPSGGLAGFTELMISPFRPWMAFQWDTGVDPKHRDLGLGRWLKAANALRLLEEAPQVEQIETWNASSNAAMLGINQAMGFRPVAEWQSWEMAV